MNVEDITTPGLVRVDAASWHEQDSVTVTWDTERLHAYVQYVRLSVYAYVEDGTTGEVRLVHVYSPNATNESMAIAYQDGQFTLEPRPRLQAGAAVGGYTVGVIRLSLYSEDANDEL